ncbi:hypothetical protein EDC04DRAFT_2610640 [Pisolithus marmoratus]|nr:hypothetical protein EDC04DRAFT_2610640 [Pisolithus marmoratus]
MPMPPHHYSFGPIVMEDVKWISVALVTFQFHSEKGMATFALGMVCYGHRGNCIQTWIHMCKVDELLVVAVWQLLLWAAEMEADAGAVPDRVAHLQGLLTMETFPSDWTLLLEELQAAVWQTAFSCY